MDRWMAIKCIHMHTAPLETWAFISSTTYCICQLHPVSNFAKIFYPIGEYWFIRSEIPISLLHYGNLVNIWDTHLRTANCPAVKAFTCDEEDPDTNPVSESQKFFKRSWFHPDAQHWGFSIWLCFTNQNFCFPPCPIVSIWFRLELL